MIDRRNDALDELATAIAQSVVDEWLDGALADDGLEPTHNDRVTNHEAASKTKAPQKRGKSAKATKKGLRRVRRSAR